MFCIIFINMDLNRNADTVEFLTMSAATAKFLSINVATETFFSWI
jgi:hypothetical protein